MKRGLTLLETLCVMAIIASLAAITSPVFASSIRAARITSQMGRLRQLHVALTLYQLDWDGSGKYGCARDMGLPANDNIEQAYRAVLPDATMWKSACGFHPDDQILRGKTVQVVYLPYNETVDGTAGWCDYAQEQQDRAMLVIDHHCVDHSTPLNSNFNLKLALGVRVGGQVERRRMWGLPTLLEGWK